MHDDITTPIKVRGVAMVRDVLAAEHREMQTRVYRRLRPYLASAMRRLRRSHPAFQTVTFEARTAGFTLVFGDGTQPREAPKAFGGLAAACGDLAKFSEIEWITASDPLWRVLRDTPTPSEAVDQYRHIESADWCFWMRRPLRDALYYMRQDIYSRTVYGSHRPGYGKRILGDGGEVIDEWTDPVKPLILRVLRGHGKAIDLGDLCRALATISGWRDGHYIWDVLKACEQLREKRALRRLNPKASEINARFALRR